MRIRHAISLENTDQARIDTIDQVYGLIGGHDFSEDDQKPFKRVRGNDFTMNDIAAIRAIVVRETAKPIPEVFLDPNLQETFASGVQTSKLLANRDLAQFTSDLEEDMRQLS